eukprot:4426-Amphidinium_carterae.1
MHEPPTSNEESPLLCCDFQDLSSRSLDVRIGTPEAGHVLQRQLLHNSQPKRFLAQAVTSTDGWLSWS